MLSRKRSRSQFSNAARALALYRPPPPRPNKRRKAFVPGATRTSGYYGRFAPSGGELKFVDFTYDDAIVSANGSIKNSICTIAQGVEQSQRIGRKCTIKSINIKWLLALPSHNGAVVPFGDTTRIIVFLDKQCNGATATVADILDTADIRSHRNLANEGRFRILKDMKYDTNYAGVAYNTGTATYIAASQQTLGNTFKKCNIPVEFNSTTGAITEIRSNNIGLLTISENGLTTWKSEIRLRFSDN